jgi:hypothetical protein
MSTSAPRPHLRYAELREWLFQNGVSHNKLRVLLTEGVIKRVYLNGARALYNADQVKRAVLDPLDHET